MFPHLSDAVGAVLLSLVAGYVDVSSFILLFGSAFSAYATAYALTSGNIALLTTEIANVLSGDVSSSPQTGAALAVGMIVVMVGVLFVSAGFSRRASRWHKPAGAK